MASRQEPFVRNATDKESGTHVPLLKAFGYAFQGLGYVFRSQRNMKVYLGMSLLALVMGVIFSIDTLGWLAISLCIALVISFECMNTALESVVDLISPEFADLAKRGKDCAAAAVLVCAVLSLVVAGIVFVPAIGSFIAA